MNTPSENAGSDPFNLHRFIEAQEHSYDRALSELKRGRKQSHWVWFIFPQMAGLGLSPTSAYYAIKDRAEAEAYLNHPVLGPRLVECCEAALKHADKSASDLMGTPDDFKLRSCATLFASVSPPGSVFVRVLDGFFEGKPDDRTFELLS